MEHIHGGDLYSFAREQPTAVLPLDFSANISPLGLPHNVRRALESCADACLHYPDPHCVALRDALSAFEGVPAHWILCGNGAADLIYRVAFALRPKRALILAPTFAEYGLALAAVGCAVEEYRLDEAADFAAADDLAERVAGNDLVFLCNPNNPTGGLLKAGQLERVMAACAAAGAVLAVDECFLDFVPVGDAHSMKRHLADHPDVIVIKAFTKIFSMPGLRLGYALMSSPQLRDRLERAGPPWSVSVPASLCGIAAAGEKDYLERCRSTVAAGQGQLTAGLAACGCKVYPAAANFLLFRAPVPALAERLRQWGILLRDCSNFPGLSDGYYRTAVRTPEENDILLEAIKRLTAGQ